MDVITDIFFMLYATDGTYSVIEKDIENNCRFRVIAKSLDYNASTQYVSDLRSGKTKPPPKRKTPPPEEVSA